MEKLKEKLDNSILWQVIFFLVSMAGVFALYFVSMNHIKFSKIVYNSVQNDYEVVTSIKKKNEENGKLILSGTAFRLASTTTDIKVVLSTNTGSGNLLIKTENTADIKVSQQFDSNWNYGLNSFIATISEKKLEKDVPYEVLIDLTYEIEEVQKNILVSTWCYLYNGELYQYNPVDFVQPEFKDEYMSEVVNNGKLILFSKERGLYVYQYQDKLHWITNEDFKFLKDTERIIYHAIGCTQNEQLGTIVFKEYVKDFYFINNQYDLGEVSEYQVAIADMKLESEYPIIYLCTGVYDSEQNIWIWSIRFKPAMGE